MTRRIAVGLLLALCLGGCRTGDRAQDEAASGNVKDGLLILKEGKARGDLQFSTGGSPFSAGMKQVFFLGPENASFSFAGSVDFSDGDVDASALLAESERPVSPPSD